MELLIVIAVITVLAALLMPGLRRAREMAIGISCTGNLRQTISMVCMYWNDYNGKIVSDSGLASWPYERQLYLAGILNPRIRSYMCPESVVPPNLAPVSVVLGNWSYSSNYTALYRNKAYFVQWGGVGDVLVDIGKLPKPSEFVFILDGKKSGQKANADKFYYSTISYGYAWAATPWTIHRKDVAVNAAFGDGHACATTKSDIRTYYAPSTEFIYDPMASW